MSLPSPNSAPSQEKAPDARIINLETAVTTNDEPWPRKGINYRMHPGGVGRHASRHAQMGRQLGTISQHKGGPSERGRLHMANCSLAGRAGKTPGMPCNTLVCCHPLPQAMRPPSRPPASTCACWQITTVG